MWHWYVWRRDGRGYGFCFSARPFYGGWDPVSAYSWPFAPELCHCVHMHSRISVQRFTAPTPYLALHYSHRQSPQTTDYNACWPHKCITNLLLMMLHLFSCSLLPYRSSNLKQRYVSLHRRSCQTTVCGACWPGWR